MSSTCQVLRITPGPWQASNKCSPFHHSECLVTGEAMLAPDGQLNVGHYKHFMNYAY